MSLQFFHPAGHEYRLAADRILQHQADNAEFERRTARQIADAGPLRERGLGPPNRRITNTPATRKSRNLTRLISILYAITGI
jgi:hypothetical protein